MSYMGFRSSEFPMIPSEGRHLVCQGIYMTSSEIYVLPLHLWRRLAALSAVVKDLTEVTLWN